MRKLPEISSELPKSLQSNQRIYLYRIYFEQTEKEASVKLIESTFKFASVYTGEGLYNGKWESFKMIEVQSTYDSFVISAFAESLRALNHQKEVRVTVSEVEVIRVKSPV